jgi:hypothetical protein
MLALNRSLLNREYTLMNVLKIYASIISVCNLHVTFLSKITPRYLALFTNGIFLPFNLRQDSGGLICLPLKYSVCVWNRRHLLSRLHLPLLRFPNNLVA